MYYTLLLLELKRGCIQILCRRHPFWSYPAGLTIDDPPCVTKAEVSLSLFTPLSPSLFTPHQILYRASLTPDTSDYLIRWTRTITELRQPENNSRAPTPILWPDYHPSWLTCVVQDVAITNMNNKHIALV